jgi:hypothetical protein
MGAIQARALGVIFSLLIIFLSGFWLSYAGKPFGGAAGFIHKFISLAAVILLINLAVHAHHAARLSGVERTVCVLAVLLFVAAIASGGVVMAGASMRSAIVAHRVVPYLVFLATVTAIWLLRRGR